MPVRAEAKRSVLGLLYPILVVSSITSAQPLKRGSLIHLVSSGGVSSWTVDQSMDVHSTEYGKSVGVYMVLLFAYGLFTHCIYNIQYVTLSLGLWYSLQ